MQHRPNRLNNRPVIPCTHPIFLRAIRGSEFLMNTFVDTECSKITALEPTPAISTKWQQRLRVQAEQFDNLQKELHCFIFLCKHKNSSDISNHQPYTRHKTWHRPRMKPASGHRCRHESLRPGAETRTRSGGLRNTRRFLLVGMLFLLSIGFLAYFVPIALPDMPSSLVNDLFPQVFISSSGDVLVATSAPCISPASSVSTQSFTNTRFMKWPANAACRQCNNRITQEWLYQSPWDQEQSFESIWWFVWQSLWCQSWRGWAPSWTGLNPGWLAYNPWTGGLDHNLNIKVICHISYNPFHNQPSAMK